MNNVKQMLGCEDKKAVPSGFRNNGLVLATVEIRKTRRTKSILLIIRRVPITRRAAIHSSVTPRTLSSVYFTANQALISSSWFLPSGCYVALCVRCSCFYSASARTSQKTHSILTLGALTELWKATIRFVMPVRPHGTTRLPLEGFWWNLRFKIFSKICREN